MADEKKKGSAPAKKKRDPNQPVPKPKKKKSSLILKVLASGVIGILLVWMSLFSIEVGKVPTSWDGDDWSAFLSFSRKQLEEAKEKVEQVDWQELRDKVTAKTKELWEKAPDLEANLEKALAELRGEKPGARVDEKTGATPAAAIAPTDLELGLQDMQQAMRAYKKTMNNQGNDQAQLKKSKKLFMSAQDHLTKAHAQAEDKGESAQAAEIEGYIQQCNIYLEDCSKRQTL